MEDYTIDALQAHYQTSTLSARDVTDAYLQRIHDIDTQGPALNAVIEVNPEALSIAERLDTERRQQGPRSPLHGIPVLVKDNIDTADQMITSAGSLALARNKAKQDAYLITQLREAGAIILGKTNLSEWANFRDRNSVSGWSSRGGQTKNPHVLNHNPCGSSSGSGAAVAANLCTVAIGTETHGSILCPASTNGIVGIKPTVGLISRSGIIPISHTMDTAGPMTRTVKDAAYLLQHMTRPDPNDPRTRTNPGAPDYLQALTSNPQTLTGVRLGVVRNLHPQDSAADTMLNNALELLRELGATIVEPLVIDTPAALFDAMREVMLYEFKAGLNAYFSRLDASVGIKSLADVIAFNHANHTQVMPLFGQQLMVLAQEKGALSDDAYQQALLFCQNWAQTHGIDPLVKTHQLDALIAPTMCAAWRTDAPDPSIWSSVTAAAIAGYPSISVPAGFEGPLPINLSFFAGAYQEAALLRYAYVFEQASQARRAPAFLPALN